MECGKVTILGCILYMILRLKMYIYSMNVISNISVYRREFFSFCHLISGYSLEDLTKIEKHKLIGSECARWVAPTFASVISLAAFLSPIAMVLLPKLTIIPGFFNQTLQVR